MRVAISLVLAVCASALMVLALPAQAQISAPRLALVIGIGDYNRDGDLSDTDRAQALASGFVTDLRNAPNDAADVAVKLQELRYQVTLLTNPTRGELLKAALDFGRLVRSVGPDAQVVVFFAGHGVQVDGANFLIPSGAQLPSIDFALMPSRDTQDLLSEYATPLSTLLGRLQPPSDRGFNLVILDACRDNPWDIKISGLSRGSGGNRGLAEVRMGLRRTALAFSTQPGDTADDGGGRNSPYTAALTRAIQVASKQPLTQMLELAASEVERVTQRQIPHLSTLGSLAGACLGGCVSISPDVKAPLDTPATEPPVSPPAPRSRVVEPEMVLVPGGWFLMGSPNDEAGRLIREGPQQRITIDSFEIAKFEVTFDEWMACVEGRGCNNYTPSDIGWGRGQRPVINVSWDDVQAYIRWLNAQTGKRYRLLSEAEWEYAARADTTSTYSVYSFGNQADKLGEFAWFLANSGGKSQLVGGRAPNQFGIYDMYGNVSEWVQDCYRGNLNGQTATAMISGDCSRRVARGGSWFGNAQGLRSASRDYGYPDSRFSRRGFRLARSLDVQR